MTGTVKIDDFQLDLIDVSLIGSYSLTKTLFQNPNAGILLKTGINHRTGERILAQVHTKPSPSFSSQPDPKITWSKDNADAMIVVETINSELFDVVVMRYQGDLLDLKRQMMAVTNTNKGCSSPCDGLSEATTLGGGGDSPTSPASQTFETPFACSPKADSSICPVEPRLSGSILLTSPVNVETSPAALFPVSPTTTPSSPSALGRLSPRNLVKSFDLLRRCKKVAPQA